MQIIKAYPPNFFQIIKSIPSARRNGVIFAYGDKIYAPNLKDKLSTHLIEHEKIHGERQLKLGIETWWKSYLTDIGFRYHEELLAHRAEYKSMIECGFNPLAALKIVSMRLSSPLYGCAFHWKKVAKDILNE
jgi:hypothetical protein